MIFVNDIKYGIENYYLSVAWRRQEMIDRNGVAINSVMMVINCCVKL
jgi:hypothetical protein